MAKEIILSINVGSSSVKLSAYTASQSQSLSKLASASISGLTGPPAQLTYTRGDVTVAKDEETSENLESQDITFKFLLGRLIDDTELPEIGDRGDIAISCHPRCASCVAALPGAINVAYFDSQFHASTPEHVRAYPIDPALARRKRLRKYGFHGISYAFIARFVAAYLRRDPGALNIIALHLGSGASTCAIKGGKSWDTSMGLTPLAGLPGATRSGSVDPSLVFHYTSEIDQLSPSSTEDLHISRAEEILNKECGWKALTGTTNFGTIVSSAKGTTPDARCKLALDLFIDRICGYVGAYYVALGGRVDALVFAGSIGEKSDGCLASCRSRKNPIRESSSLIIHRAL
ncbi:acetate kinase [Xylaria castorea]|nr:acetate kinase [Xylaria castorea]